jgi:hypothetical protein
MAGLAAAVIVSSLQWQVLGSARRREGIPEDHVGAHPATTSAPKQAACPRFPVSVTHLPVTRCQICQRTVAYRPGTLTEVLTGHYRRAHPEALDLASLEPTAETPHYVTLRSRRRRRPPGPGDPLATGTSPEIGGG